MLCKSSLKPFLLPLALSIFVSACGGGGSGGDITPSIAPSPPPPAVSTAELRLQELDIIDTTLRNNHPDMFFKLSETDWRNQLIQLNGEVEDMSDLGFIFETTKLVATLGDQHTYMIMPDEQLRQFPLQVWWDEDRAIVTKAGNDYQQYLGYELRSIDGTPMTEIRETVMQYLAFENEYWKVGISPMFLRYAEIMAYEGLIASTESASVEFVALDGSTTQVDVNTTIGATELVSIESTMTSVPAYFTHIEDNYSVQLVEDDLFIQYVSAFDIPFYEIDAFVADLQVLISSNDIDDVIVDLRFNHGGRIDHFLPVIEFLAGSAFNTPQDLFVLTGRNTFSSGVGATYAFVNLTNATFVGMPTGGKPNGFSNVAGLGLPVSGNSLFLALDYLAVTEGDPDTFMPDHLTPFTQNDFLTGNDPALAFIASQ